MGRDDRSDERLLAATRRDPAAFGPVYERHAPAVLAYLRSRTRSTEQALDLTAEVFAAALQSAHRYRPGRRRCGHGCSGSPTTSWSTRCGGRAPPTPRCSGSRIATLELSEDELTAVDRRLSAQPDGELALRLVGDLPPDQRAAVMARVVDEADYRELAARFETSEQNVRARVHRGLRRVGVRLAAMREERTR